MSEERTARQWETQVESTIPSMTEKSRRALTAAVKKYREAGPCQLCGATSAYFGVFFPPQEFSARIGAPKGKTRVVFYRVCESCYELPNVTELVEAGILSDLQVQ
jgi:hypothetical protein